MVLLPLYKIVPSVNLKKKSIKSISNIQEQTCIQSVWRTPHSLFLEGISDESVRHVRYPYAQTTCVLHRHIEQLFVCVMFSFICDTSNDIVPIAQKSQCGCSDHLMLMNHQN